MTIFSTLRSTITALASLVVRPASAHCDTEDGPAVTDGRRALATGNVNIALKWVRWGDEDEIKPSFERALRLRAAGDDAAKAAERQFLETLVRVHRAGEGAGFDGIQPSGTPIPPQVRAADQALAEGTMEPLRGLVEPERRAELERRFHQALALKDFDDDDLVAARRYMDAYVSFFKYAEGEEHDHHRSHDHQDHDQDAHAHHEHASAGTHAAG